MNQPKVQTDFTEDGASSDHNPTGTTPHGIPDGMAEGDAKGRPTSDRGATEMVVDTVEKDKPGKA